MSNANIIVNELKIKADELRKYRLETQDYTKDNIEYTEIYPLIYEIDPESNFRRLKIEYTDLVKEIRSIMSNEKFVYVGEIKTIDEKLMTLEIKHCWSVSRGPFGGKGYGKGGKGIGKCKNR